MKPINKTQNSPLFLPALFGSLIFILLFYSIALMIMQLLKTVNNQLLSIDFIFTFIMGIVSLICASFIVNNRSVAKNKKLVKILGILALICSSILCIGGLFNALFSQGAIIPLVIVLLDWYIYGFVIIAMLTCTFFVIILFKECSFNKSQFKTMPIIVGLCSLSFVAIVPVVPISFIHTSYSANFKFIGHRGYSAKYFQNSASAFDSVTENAKGFNNFWGFETDIQMDNDGGLWCSHYINPFEDQSLKISDLSTEDISSKSVKTNGSIDPSTLGSKSFPAGKINPYHVKNIQSNHSLLPFGDEGDSGDAPAGYLSYFLHNNFHPIIELKVDSLVDVDGRSSSIDSTRLSLYIVNITKTIVNFSTLDPTLPSRIIFISFFDDLLHAMMKEITDNSPSWGVSYQKLLDDGSIGQYVKKLNQPNSSFTRKDSETNWKNWKNYVNGSWTQSYDQTNVPISINPYYAFVTNNMISTAHKHKVEVNCYTADYTRLEMCEPISLAILAKSGIDMITCDDYFRFN